MRFLSIIISLLLVATAIFGIYHIVVLFSNIKDPSVDGDGKPSSESVMPDMVECDENVTSSGPCFGLVMVTRNEWVAQPAHNAIGKLQHPARRIILTDTQTEECSMKPKCIYIVRNIQGDHVLSKDDIKYNFLINTQGDIYEGRGWALQSAQESDDNRVKSYWIALIGNFTAMPAWEKQVQGVRRFAEHAVSAGLLISTYNIYCSQDTLILLDKISGKVNGSYMECLNTN